MSKHNIRTIAGEKYMVMESGTLVPYKYHIERKKILKPKDAWEMLTEERVQVQEVLVVLTLDGGHQVINKHVVTRGLANQCQIHPREVFRPAIQDAAVAIVCAHNHPSGELAPSEADVIATRKLAEAGKVLGIPLLDHIIVTSSNGFSSIRERHQGLFHGCD